MRRQILQQLEALYSRDVKHSKIQLLFDMQAGMSSPISGDASIGDAVNGAFDAIEDIVSAGEPNSIIGKTNRIDYLNNALTRIRNELSELGTQ